MPTLDPARVSHGEWAGENVSLDEVMSQLNRLRAEFAVHGARGEAPNRSGSAGPVPGAVPPLGDVELPHSRNSVMNLVVVAADEEHADRAAKVGEELGAQHPSRTIVILPVGGKGDRLDCRIRSHAHVLVSGAPVQYEEVRLNVWGTRARLQSLIEPLLASDVRTHLWWLGTPPWDTDAFCDVLPGIDTLIVDSASFGRPYESFLKLAEVAGSLSDPRGVADFEWVRLHPWREALAQAFAPPHRIALLRGINALGLDYAGEGRANRGSAALLAGWLIESLHWELRSASAGQGGLVRARYQAPHGHLVEVGARSVGVSSAAPEGTLMAIRIEGAAGGVTVRAELERDRENPRRGTLMLGVANDDPIRHEFPLEDMQDAAMLSVLLMTGRRDPIYLRSLDSAAKLLSALK